jgi:PAS domain S-box-containing protein
LWHQEYRAARQVKRSSDRVRLVQEYVGETFDLSLLAREYADRPSRRAARQWKNVQTRMRTLLEKIRLNATPAETNILDTMKADLESLGEILAARHAAPGSREDPEYAAHLMDQSFIVLRTLVASSRRLVENALENQRRTASKAAGRTLMFAFLVGVAVAGFGVWTWFSIAWPLARLKRSLEIVGAGDLEHRAALAPRDELGDFSREFDRMTARLRETLAGRDELAVEIEARARAEKKLEEERRQLLLLFENMDDVIYVSDPDTFELLYVNPAFARFWGEDVIGKKCHRVLQGRDSPCPFCTNPRIFGENFGKTEVWEFQNEKTRRWYRCTDKAIRWADGRWVRFELASDITKEKAAARERNRLAKLSSLGRLSAGVAHEMNNPMMGIINYAQYCLALTPNDDKRHAVLKDIEKETRRCLDIVHSLTSFVRSTESDRPMDTDLSSQLEQVRRLLTHRLTEENATLSFHVPDTLPRIALVPDRFQQVLLNLLTNALDAVAETPEKRIDVEAATREARLEIVVRDTGEGIPEENRERIFDPFFTTRSPGKGTGLGLATCWSLVHERGGTIECESRPGEGTAVTVRIPLSPPHADH